MSSESAGSAEDVNLNDEWLIRPCNVYKEEYNDCTSIKGRFHQYYIYGKTVDCNTWKRDFDNCIKWKENKDVKAGKELTHSIEEKRMKRLRAHYDNDVWEKRTSPPEDWNSPLPEYLQKQYQNTYLSIKAGELQGGAPSSANDRTLCVIS